ncbi:MAG: metal-dependent hydrolase [Candidatus Dactylopiibacterium carminicum]|nr:MAG: metal-dependent hydrolase [Candidatus Dactylopiibacterium carminicum]
MSASTEPRTNYLAAYPEQLVAQVRQLIADGKLGALLLRRYPQAHTVRNERALQDCVTALKNRHLKSAPPLAHIGYDNHLHVLRNALGTHTAISRVQGSRLKAKRELRIASLFRVGPEEFLRMIVVHELAHLKEREHGKAFYQLCCHMEPAYHQYEFDLRAYLCWLDAGGAPPWC